MTDTRRSSRAHPAEPMTRPLILAVDDSGDVLTALDHAPHRRYGADYEILAERFPAAALEGLQPVARWLRLRFRRSQQWTTIASTPRQGYQSLTSETLWW